MSDGSDEVRNEFKRRRTRQIMAMVPVVAAVFLVATRDGDGLAIGGLPEAVVGAAMFAIVAAAIVFSLMNWRCPSCRRYLGRTINPSFCPKCGVQLR